jgi:hypothetical protein
MYGPYFVHGKHEQTLRQGLREALPPHPANAEVIDLAIQAAKNADRAFFETLELASNIDVARLLLPVAISVARAVFDNLLDGAIDFAREQGENIHVTQARL